VIVTEWDAFRALDLNRLGSRMEARVLIDLRNIYNAADVAAAGFSYTGVGRPAYETADSLLEAAE
jgi:UDPglucose 6-dehydrogenase